MRLLAFGRGRTDRRRLPVNSRAVLYLRSGLYVGYTAGGSVGHLTGVTSGLARLGYAVTVHSSERLPFLTDPRVGARVIPAGRPFRNFPEIRSMRYGEIFAADILAEARGRDAPRFVYQRQSLNDVSGALIAARLGVPLVIEYNGSEVWSSRYWGNSRLTFARVSSRLEDACFAQADLIVVVSQPLREELVARGVPAEKVLVNPNGVDPDRYSPTRFTPGETAATRAELGVPDGAVVVGFVGTFSPWHGVDVLAKAIPEAVRGGDVRFLLIGDGPLLAFLRRDVDAAGASASVVYTGLVPQHETPRLLACCDLFVSPQVDNPDGTRFFGSPTKLFEYMAFGRGIVASRAGQIGEILTDGESAVLVRPGDAGELAAGISRLARDPELRERLGLAARRRVLDRHTWDHHVARILAALEERCGAGPPTANAARR
jgi:glycosyltransferase involved in cell wall biosynthesis